MTRPLPRPIDGVTQLRLCDLGSADSGQAEELAAAGHAVVAVDIELGLLRKLRERSGLPVVQADAAALPFRPDSFDGAFLLEVLEHVDDPPAFVAEAARIVRVGGSLTVAVPTSYTEHVYWRLHPRYAENATHVRIFRKSELMSLFQAQDLRVDRVESRNLLPALLWLGHSLARSEADHTGRITNHGRITAVLTRGFEMAAAMPGTDRLLRWMSTRVGKSWYVSGTKVA